MRAFLAAIVIVFAALLVLACAATAASAAEPKADSGPANWDGPQCKPVDRETTYEFTTVPSVRKVGPDKYEIAFAVKSRCDVAVAIEESSGRIVRHLVYGVLGSNAPAPLQKDSLQQTLYWNGKDEFGRYVKDAEQCRVRVSLGLKPTFDKSFGWHPKDTSAERHIAAISADADGVYLLETSSFSQLRHYDHDGNYLKTLYPWDPEQLDKVRVAKRTLPDAKIWTERPPAGSRVVPVLEGYGATRPFHRVQDTTCMAVAAGKIGLYTVGGYGDIRQLLRMRTDGTTGGEAMEGPIFSKKDSGNSYAGQGHIVLSPDGKWVYVSGLARSTNPAGNDLRLEKRPYQWHAVFRFAWDEAGPVVETRDSFAGEVSQDPKLAGAGSGNEHFNSPQGLACDSQGRLYVADSGNNRIQVLSAEGKYLKTIPVKEPQEIAVHPRTGEIYVLCFRKGGGGVPKAPLTLYKFGSLADPTERLKQTFPVVGDEYAGVMRFTPVMGLDAWAKEPRIWLVHEAGAPRVYAEKDMEFQLIHDFKEEVRRAGYVSHAMPGTGMGLIAADPVRGHLYRGSALLRPIVRLDPEEGKTWQPLDISQMPNGWGVGGVEELVVSANGLLHVKTLKYLARFNPDKFKAKIVLDAACEVPFDYGEEKSTTDRKGVESPANLRGVIAFPWAMGGANGYNYGTGISPRGEVLVLIKNFQSDAAWKGVQPPGVVSRVEATPSSLAEVGEERFRPALFPGRVWGMGHLVWRFDNSGQAVSVDAIPGLTDNTFGIRTDAAGNLFIGVGYHQNVNGKPHIGGSLAKFAPQGAKLVRDFGTPVKLENVPDRPADFLGGGKVWARNMFWSLPGLDQIQFVDEVGTRYPCACFHCRFDTDLYGRSFAPRAYGYHVAVVDTNGNRVCEIGRYGNADKPAMKPGDTDIGLGNCSFVTTVSDKWLYINDEPNLRLVRLKLGYQTETRVALSGQ